MDSIGLTFAKFLKHALRQDPDIVMVGEIRDRETAEIARPGIADRTPGTFDSSHQ